MIGRAQQLMLEYAVTPGGERAAPATLPDFSKLLDRLPRPTSFAVDPTKLVDACRPISGRTA